METDAAFSPLPAAVGLDASTPQPPPPPTRHGSAVGLTSLPPFLAQSILQMAVPAYEQQKLSVRNLATSAVGFRALAGVCRAWKALAVDAASNVALCALVVSVQRATRSELLELRRQLTLQRAFLLLLDVHQIPSHGMIRADQWAAALSCAPRVEELKLDSLQDERFAQRGAIVRAAGEQCRHLQSLVVSPAHRDNQVTLVPVEYMRRELTDPVFYTMEQVYQTTHHVGLRRLCVGMRHDLQGLDSTRQYMDRVLRFCPNLERFDGYRAAVYAIDERIAFEQWAMDVPLWTRFCATLSQLVEFDWICVPFATRFFEVFGQHAKPQMKAMLFTAAMNWRWERYLEDIGPEQRAQLTETGYASSAKHAQKALSACPNLTQLSVYWYNQPPVPVDTQLMDPDIFGDEFWETAVRLCPLLAKVSMVGVSNATATSVVRSFTDRSLRALARLRRLVFLECQSVNVTGDGIFELAVHHARPYSRRERSLNLLLGTSEGTDMGFYDAISVFLKNLLTMDAPLSCMNHATSTSIDNKRRVPVETEWSVAYLATLKQLLAQVKEKHPGVYLFVFANDCDGAGFSQVSQLVFSTRDVERQWVEFDDVPVGDSLWNRVPLSGSDDDDDDDDMSDDGSYYDEPMDHYYDDEFGYSDSDNDMDDDDYDDDYGSW